GRFFFAMALYYDLPVFKDDRMVAKRIKRLNVS
ncbi:MAG: hypothetical protein ACI8P3_000951, partial [Saprospiraceae bacterium]